MSGPVKGLLAPGLMEQPQPRGLLDMLYPQGWRGGLFGMGNPTGAYLDQRELSRPGVNPGASPMSNRDLARQYAVNIGSGMGTDAGAPASIGAGLLGTVKSAAPKYFWRATSASGGKRRIRTGNSEWDSYLFAADNKESAAPYGGSDPIFEKIQAKPEAKILREGTRDFISIMKGFGRGRNLLEFSAEAAKRAKAAGYDAVMFKRQGDVGTAIINPNAFIRGLPDE